MMRVLHISDTHFGTEREPVVHALHALADTLRPDLVVLGGDITQRARRGQFAAARRFIQALQRPVLAVPGNHDIPLFNLAARLFDPYGNYRRALGAVLEPVYEDDRLLAIASTARARRVARTARCRVRRRSGWRSACVTRVPASCGWWRCITRCTPWSRATSAICSSGASSPCLPGSTRVST